MPKEIEGLPGWLVFVYYSGTGWAPVKLLRTWGEAEAYIRSRLERACNNWGEALQRWYIVPLSGVLEVTPEPSVRLTFETVECSDWNW